MQGTKLTCYLGTSSYFGTSSFGQKMEGGQGTRRRDRGSRGIGCELAAFVAWQFCSWKGSHNQSTARTQNNLNF